MVTYQENCLPQAKSIELLYQAHNWLSYTKNMELTMRGIKNSLFMITATVENNLVGFIRVVGDGFTIIYIQDILVHPHYQQQGIGEELLTRVLERYPNVRQKVLLTDASKETKYVRDFYRKLGFKSCDNGQTVAMARFEN